MGMDKERTEQIAAETSPSDERREAARDELPLPPPTFEFLTWSLRMQAEAYLGCWAPTTRSRPDPTFAALATRLI
jgi:hypothetical protein